MNKLKDNIKLIICDVDGTLIQDYEAGLNPKIFDIIDIFSENGIHFAIASGRQYPSLEHVFNKKKDKIYFIAENGGVTFYKGEIIETCEFPYNKAIELAKEINEHPLCETMVSAPKNGYYSHPSSYFLDAVELVSGSKMIDVDDINNIPAPILKVSAFVKNGAADFQQILDDFRGKWGNYNMAVAGLVWIDFTIANKGMAVIKLAADLGVKPDEILVFGDNFNDISMFDVCKNSFAMPASHKEVKSHAKLGVCHDIIGYLSKLAGM